MKQTLFIDEYFAINFIMDYLIVWTVCKITSIKATTKRKLFTCFLGSIFACVYVILPLNGIIVQAGFHIITALLMSVILSDTLKPVSFIKLLVLMNLFAAFFSGMLNYLFYTGILSGILKNKTLLFVLSVAIIFVVTKFVVNKLLELKKSYKPQYLSVTLFMNDKSVTVKALVDTGNTLREPISGAPVHIVMEKYIYEIIGDVNVYDLKLRMIPFHSIGKDGILKAVIIDKMQTGGEIEETYINPVIGLFKGELSKNEDYQMLLNRNGK